MWEARFERFPENTPISKEYYLLRSIFEERFPSEAALNTVPKGFSMRLDGSADHPYVWPTPSWAHNLGTG